jgi:MFS transporter, DHA1 family, tetracycline resistance protein
VPSGARGDTVAPSVPRPRSPLLPIFLVVLVDVLGLTIMFPLLPFYAQHYGAKPFTVGLLVSSYALCQLISGPILGRLSDRFGRRPVLLLSQAGTFLGFLLLANSNALWMIFLSRIIDGATAGNLTVAQAYIADVTEAKDRAKSFAVIGIAFGIGFLVGPAVGGELSQYGYSVPVYLAAALSFTSILATAFLLPDERTLRPERSLAAAGEVGPAGRRLGLFDWGAYAQYFRRPALATSLVQFFLFAFAFAVFTSGFSLFAERRFVWDGHAFRAREVSFVFAYAGLLGVFIQGGLVGRVVRRFGERHVAIVGFALSAVAYALLGWSATIVVLIVSMTIAAFGTGPLRPALTSLVSRNAAAEEQGVVLGLSQSLGSVAQITAPLLGGWLIQHDRLAGWAALAAGAMAVGTALAIFTRADGSAPGAAPAMRG